MDWGNTLPMKALSSEDKKNSPRTIRKKKIDKTTENKSAKDSSLLFYK